MALGRITRGRFRIVKYYLYRQPVAVKTIIPERRGKNITVRQIDPTDSNAFADFPRPGTVIGQRFGQGAVCFAAYIEDRFVGYVWLNLGDYTEDEVRCIFSPQPEDTTAWDYDVYVEPSARNGFIFPKLWQAANDYLNHSGVAWSLSRISAFNVQSQRSHERLGARANGSATFICLGRTELMIAGHPPYVHVSIMGGKTPIMRIDVKHRSGGDHLQH
jgi:hypothetical protein